MAKKKTSKKTTKKTAKSKSAVTNEPSLDAKDESSKDAELVKSNEKSATKSESTKHTTKKTDKTQEKDSVTQRIIAGIAVGIIVILLVALLIMLFNKTTLGSNIATANSLSIEVVESETGVSFQTELTGEKIQFLESDLDYLELLFKINNAQVTKEGLIEEAIIREILLQNAQKESLTPDLSMIEELRTGVLFAQRISELNITVDDFLSKYEQDLSDDILIQEYFNAVISSKVPLENAYETSHILICYEGSDMCTSNRTKDEAFQFAQELSSLAKETNNAEYFADLARDNSDGPSAPEGGYLGQVLQGMMVPEFEAATFSLLEGEVSSPVETNFGFHIIRVNSIEQTPNQRALVEALTTLKTEILAKAEIQMKE